MHPSFLESHRLAVTTISPVHIGCGEVYEPTNYVIDDKRGFLYGFNPAEAYLTEADLQALRPIVTDYKKITLFYSQHVDAFRPWARNIIPVGANVRHRYQKMLFPKNLPQAALEIERTAYEAGSRQAGPYIPGSSLKGAVATALAERLNQGRPLRKQSDVQALFGGDFEKSPMRFLRIGDLRGENALTRVFSSKRFFKSDLKPDGSPMFFEALMPAQFRAFAGDATLAAGQNTHLPHVYERPEDIMRDLHRYSLARWNDEVAMYRAVAPSWTREVEKLLAAMVESFRAGRAALVRLGKNAGAQSKTLHVEVHSKDRTQDESTESQTLCLTDETEDAWNGLPYGWAVIEVNPGDEASPLEDWCERMRAAFVRASIGGAVCDEWDRVLTQKKARIELREAKAKELEAERFKRRQEAEQEARKAQALAAMSEEARLTATICDALETSPENVIKSGTALFNEVKALLEAALKWTDPQEKLELAQRIQPLMKKKDMYQGKAAKTFKAQLRELRGEA